MSRAQYAEIVSRYFRISKPKTVAPVIVRLESRIACVVTREIYADNIFSDGASLTQYLQIPRAYARTHARTHVYARDVYSHEIPKRADTMLFTSGKKLLKRIEELQTRSEMLVYCMSDNALFIPEEKLTRAYVYNREWETRRWAEKQIEDKVLVLWKEALNLGSCYAPTDFELI